MTIKSGVMEIAGHLDETGSGNDEDGNIIRETGRWGQEAEKVSWPGIQAMRTDALQTGRRKKAYTFSLALPDFTLKKHPRFSHFVS